MENCREANRFWTPAQHRRWQRSTFDGDKNNYDLWEVKFLGHLRTTGLKDTILSTTDPEPEKNAERYVELIQLDETQRMMAERCHRFEQSG